MSDPITQIPKPRIDSYADKRKLFLVPVYIAPKENAEEGQKILTEYWIEVSEQITSFEQKLGKIKNIFAVSADVYRGAPRRLLWAVANTPP